MKDHSQAQTLDDKIEQLIISVTHEETYESKDEELSDKETITSEDDTESVVTNNIIYNYDYLMEVSKKIENGIEIRYLPALIPSIFANVPPTINFVTQEENRMSFFFKTF